TITTMKLVCATFLAAFWPVLLGPAFAQAPEPWQEPLSQRHWEQAEPLLKQALDQNETVAALRGLATVYRATGRLAAADPLLERVVALEETVANVEDLAKIKVALPNLRRAEELYRRALYLRGKSGQDELTSIVTHQRLAQILVGAQKYPE